MSYRRLTDSEISRLKHQGCTSSNWETISVTENFAPDSYRQVEFLGNNFLSGHDQKRLDPFVISNCTINNCIIEDSVSIKNVSRLENYIIRSHSKIENCGTITADDHPDFGIGSEASVINEGGGREIILYEQLNAPIAHLLAFMHHSPEFIKNLKSLIRERIYQQKYDKGIIGHHANLVNCNAIKNVKVDDCATLEGISLLEDGSILSSHESPAYIGHQVIAKKFIISKGSQVTDGSIIKNSFIGEGCQIERQFSAENCVVFSNSQLYHGEACSAFCAPYTVSHHKSTLLIAGYFSFINIGSGSNQSNHMYKLGPLHQGILERGCKLSSDSYLLWPGKIGPYTFVMGRHYSNPDLGNFPFSYLLDNEGKSYLVPGANFRSIGTIRDAKKWPDRDIRQGEKKDPIHFDLLNPFIINKVKSGKELLSSLKDKISGDTIHINIGQVRIKKPALIRGIDIYNEIIILYYGDLIYNRFKNERSTINTILKNLISKDPNLIGDWNDLSGLLLPTYLTDEIIKDIETEKTEKLSQLEKKIDKYYSEYKDHEWNWALNSAPEILGHRFDQLSVDQFAEFLSSYKSKLQLFLQMMLKDAQKEFSETAKIGYGYKEKDNYRQSDFESVRGNIKNNSFINLLNDEVQQKINWIESVLC